MFVSRETTNEPPSLPRFLVFFKLIVSVLYYTTSLSVRRSILSKKKSVTNPRNIWQTDNLATIDFI